MANKLAIEFRIKQYLGLSAVSKDNGKVGTITNFHVYKKPDGEYTVDYLLAFGTHPHAVVRLVNEEGIVIINNKKVQ